MRFIYYFILGLNLFVLSADANNNDLHMGINKCKIYYSDLNALNVEKSGHKGLKISVTSKVKIRKNRINLAISEAKLKAKKKLIKFLIKMEDSDNRRYSVSPNNSLKYDLTGAFVTQICIENAELLKLTLEINDISIINAEKIRKLLNK